MKRKDFFIIWPQYFDKSISRSKGRKLPFKDAVDTPSIESLIKAATLLRLSFEVDKEARYPASWWQTSGRLLVKKVDTKYSLLRKMAMAMGKK